MWPLALLFGGGMAMLVALPLPAAEKALQSADYDIAEQSLDQALTLFSTTSRVAVAFEKTSLRNHRSRAIRGRFTPQAALTAMLEGSGLVARFTAPDSAIIFQPTARRNVYSAPPQWAGIPQLQLSMAEVRAPFRIGGPRVADNADYAQRAARELRQMLAADETFKDTGFRVRIAVVLDPAGRIESVAVVRGSGDRLRDRKLPGTLLGRHVSAPPPDLRQPLRFDLTADALIRNE